MPYYGIETELSMNNDIIIIQGYKIKEVQGGSTISWKYRNQSHDLF